jgi:dihydroorotate dehydrogenase electron transfer subunit
MGGAHTGTIAARRDSAARAREQHVVLQMDVLHHVALELFEAQVERAPGAAGGGRRHEVLGELAQPGLRLLFGGRNRAALSGLEDVEPTARVFASTDDGSHGFHGMVTALLDDLIARGEVKAGEVVFCCGPDPMMHAVAALCEKRGLRCFLSLETYMACGYGVCNGCTVKVQGPRFKGWPYSRTCMEGPVYEACELVH